MTVEFTVYGEPAPQGSKRHVGGGRMIESSKKVKPWREAVKWAAIEAGHGGELLEGPLLAVLEFTVPKPKSAPKTRRTYPSKKPDLDKLVRSTMDGLTDAGVWRDDAQVVRLVSEKRYVGDMLDRPGCKVMVSVI